MGRGLCINADDWGRSARETDRIIECIVGGPVRNASAMVWMEDSERAALLSKDYTQVDFGLHLNFTELFTGESVPERIAEDLKLVRRFLGSGDSVRRYVPHLGLIGAFERLVEAQVAEFARLYGDSPVRADGHLHMHLSTNGLWALRRFPGNRVRRNFTFEAGEKSFWNRCLRGMIDTLVSQRFSVTDRFYSLETVLNQGSISKIVEASRSQVVELMTHPIYPSEGAFLVSSEGRGMLEELSIPFRDLASKE